MKILIVVVVIVCWCQVMMAAEEWKPAKAPLLTRWGKEVSPEKVLPEYPRPGRSRR